MTGDPLVCCDQKPAAPERICSKRWCLAERAPDSTVCAIHRAHPDFQPEELAAKEGHFNVAAEWLDGDCKDCDGTGEADHDCGCEHCSRDHDDCEACDGSGERETCSLCGFQCDWTTKQAEHEAKCWVPAVKPQAVAS